MNVSLKKEAPNEDPMLSIVYSPFCNGNPVDVLIASRNELISSWFSTLMSASMVKPILEPAEANSLVVMSY